MIYCGVINGRHTAQVIGNKLDDIIQDLKLEEKVCKVITTDNAKSMLNATQRVSDFVDLGLGCVDHLLQLIINNALKKVPEMQLAVKRFKKLAKATHKSALNITRIRKACSDLNRSESDPKKHCTFVKIHNPVDTRWNSLLMMIRGVIHLKPALLSIKYDVRDRANVSPLSDLIPEDNDFELLDKIVPLLTNIENTSELLSGDKYPTICHVVPKMYRMKLQMASVKTVQTELPEFAPVREMVQLMYDDLESRFPMSGADVDVYAFGTILHPGYRSVVLREIELEKRTVERMVKENEIVEPDDATTTERDLLNEPIAAGEMDEFEDDANFFLKLTQKHNPAPSASQATQSQSLIAQTPLENEIARYLNHTEPGANFCTVDMDVLAWWRDNYKIYPLMANMAKKYLSIQATSCSSERTFSTGGRTVSNTRTRLGTTNVHMIVYCKENMDKVKLINFKTDTLEEEHAEEEAEDETDEEEFDIEDLV